MHNIRYNFTKMLNTIFPIIVYIWGVTIYVFVPNRHDTGTSVGLQRWTAVCKCGVHSVNMANAKACFEMRN